MQGVAGKCMMMVTTMVMRMMVMMMMVANISHVTARRDARRGAPVNHLNMLATRARVQHAS